MEADTVTDYTSDIAEYVALEKSVLDKLDISAINEAMNVIDETRRTGGTIWIFGNGGSAATASHYQNDFNKGVSEFLDQKFRFLCLNDNVATLTAVANDIGYDEVYRFPLINNIKDHDIVVAISGSGNSANVVNAVEYAKSQNALVIGLTGFDGGKLKTVSDISLHVPVNSMQVTEDIHMVFDHLMMSIFYRHLAGREHLLTN